MNFDYDDFAHDNNPFGDAPLAESVLNWDSPAGNSFSGPSTSGNSFSSSSHLWEPDTSANTKMGSTCILGASGASSASKNATIGTFGASSNALTRSASAGGQVETPVPENDSVKHTSIQRSSEDSGASQGKVQGQALPADLSDTSDTPPQVSGYQQLRDLHNFSTVYYTIPVRGDGHPDAHSVALRRYSDFVSLRGYLIKFFQTKVIPPVPEKHSLSRRLRHPFDYKSDQQIIDRRIRLLNYFLQRLWEDPEIRASPVLAKFLDGDEKYWVKLLNAPPFTTLSSSSILLTSSRDPTAPNPYFAFLPTPPRSLLRRYHSDLNETVFRPLEVKVRKVLSQAKQLEATATQLVKDFDANRESMVQLGGFFNIFSIIEDEHELIEHFGNKIDLNFLNIEVLTQALTVNVKEKLMIIRLTLQAILHMLQFRRMKELQLSYLQDIIIKRQARLKAITDRVLAEKRLDEMMQSGDIESPSLHHAIEDLKTRRQASERLDSALNPITGVVEEHVVSNDVHYVTSRRAVSKMSSDELETEMNQLSQELDRKLVPCFNDLTKDVEYLSIGTEHNINEEMRRIIHMLQQLMDDWRQDVFGEYVRSCQEVWES